MNTPIQDQFPELPDLLAALCEESLTAAQAQRLEDLVLAHPEVEARYVQTMAFQADMLRHFGSLPTKADPFLGAASSGSPAAAPDAPPAPFLAKLAKLAKLAPIAPERRANPRARWLGRTLLGFAALAATVLLTVALRPRPATPNPARLPEVMDETVAVLGQALGAVWEGPGQLARVGAPLKPGWLRLKTGTAQLEFYNGAMVILEGPVELLLVSRTQAYCARGKLRATVPPQAVGFTIGSPNLDVVDLGTEFGLQVEAEGKTEVHVFKGKVELHNPGTDRQVAASQELSTGQSVRLDTLKAVQPIEQNAAAFPTAEDLAKRVTTEIQKRRENWRAASAAWRHDPDLLVYYTFQNDEAWSRTLRDQAGERAEPRDGAIVGCSWGTGRWPGKEGLEFKRVSDRVRFSLPGTLNSITLMTWVRIDTLQNRNNALMMGDGWPPGGLHWQIGDNGMLVLGVQGKRRQSAAHYDGPDIVTPERLALWLHLAVTYDHVGKQVTHYVDGAPVAKMPVLFDIPLVVGDAEIGNWNVATHRNDTPIRNLHGCMDEFMLWSRALTDQEVQQVYSESQPAR